MVLSWLSTVFCYFLLIVTSHATTSRHLRKHGKLSDQDCTSPPRLLHGIYYWVDSSTVQFRCRPGYVLIGSDRSQCVRGRWSTQPPVCLGRNCPMSHFKNGTAVSHHGGGLVEFRCREGFKLKGPQLLACMNGKWNGSQPECIWNLRPISQKGRELNSRRRHDKTVNRYNQYQERGSKYEEMKTHADWLEEADYTCIRSDRTVPPPKLSNALQTTRWAMRDGKPRLYTVYRCKWGYAARSTKTNNKMYCRRFTWVGLRPHCLPFIEEDPVQGDVIGLANYLPHESLLRHADYTCLRVKPPVVQQAEPNVTFAILDAKPHLFVKYTCEAGYILSDTRREHMYCKNGRWIGVMPSCKPREWIDDCRVHNGGCMHQCDLEAGIVKCSCYAGHQLSDNQRNCEDVDECAVNNAGCHHMCENTLGSYKCGCYPGYVMQSDGRTCYVAGYGQRY